MESILLSLLIVATVISLGTCGRTQFEQTLVDKSLLRQEEMKFFFRLNSRLGNAILPNAGQEYKCRILRAFYRNAQATYRNRPEQDILTSQVRTLLNECSGGRFRTDDFFNQTLIFPGTKWCGQANVAENYYDLGLFNETDACCREHDFCDDIIQSGRTKHNLINPYGTTRLHCKCDKELRKCFRNVRSVIANTVGYIFFSLLQTQCFDFNYPTTGCEQWRRGAVRLYCVKYSMDTSQPRKWQWFDQEPYF